MLNVSDNSLVPEGILAAYAIIDLLFFLADLQVISKQVPRDFAVKEYVHKITGLKT